MRWIGLLAVVGLALWGCDDEGGSSTPLTSEDDGGATPAGTTAAEPSSGDAQGDSAISQPDGDVTEPEGDVTEPEEDVTEPEEDVAEPEEDVAEPEEDVAEPEEDTSEHKPPPGNSNDSCGSSLQDLEPVDCTENGDVDSVCVFSNHCMCSAGFVCEEEFEGLTGTKECAPGSSCIPEPFAGSAADSCGSPSQGLEPVDCTSAGDLDAQCVFSNHCMCTHDFICEGESSGISALNECAPGIVCVPDPYAGSWSWSCGQESQGLVPVDCTAYGDTNAYCIYSNHCSCSEGFACDATDGDPGGGGECLAGYSCEPTEDG